MEFVTTRTQQVASELSGELIEKIETLYAIPGSDKISVPANTLLTLLSNRETLLKDIEYIEPQTETNKKSRIKRSQRANTLDSRTQTSQIITSPTISRFSFRNSLQARYAITSTKVLKILSNNPSFISYDQTESLPAHKIVPLTTSRPLSFLKGPGESSAPLSHYGDFACGKSISNYPFVKGRPYREGDPICDCYFLKLFENRIVACISDAHYWGISSRKASKRAISQFMSTMEEFHKEIKTLRSAGPVLLASLAATHLRIQEDINIDDIEPRTVSFLGGVLLETESSEKQKVSLSPELTSLLEFPFVFVFVSAGDCKCYHYSAKTKKLTDYTPNDLVQQKFSIGGSAAPKGFQIDYIPCQQNDLIIMCTSGTSDNFNPVLQGKNPEKFSVEENIIDDSLCAAYSLEYISNIIGENPTVTSVVQSMLGASQEITRPSREFMEQNPHGKLSPDMTVHTGRMDHATCQCFRAGRVTLSYEEWVGNT